MLPADEQLARWLRKEVLGAGGSGRASSGTADKRCALLLAANKCERRGGVEGAVAATLAESMRLGLGEPVALSAMTGEGMTELYSALQPLLDPLTQDRQAAVQRLVAGSGGGAAPSTQGLGAGQPQPATGADHGGSSGSTGSRGGSGGGGGQPMKIAIMGLPNVVRPRLPLTCTRCSQQKSLGSLPFKHASPLHTPPLPRPQQAGTLCVLTNLPPCPSSPFPVSVQGKSTLTNWLLQEERCLTGPEPGLTRDAVRGLLSWQGRQVELVDTAGWVRRTHLARYDDCGAAGGVTRCSFGLHRGGRRAVARVATHRKPGVRCWGGLESAVWVPGTGGWSVREARIEWRLRVAVPPCPSSHLTPALLCRRRCCGGDGGGGSPQHALCARRGAAGGRGAGVGARGGADAPRGHPGLR